MKSEKTYDLFIIGGGINGCGIARDAVGRGLSVCLSEQSDLASGTSSGSTKLIHGGLRYLEHYEFALVRKSLIERETLWKIAPHIIRPLRFVLPHHKELRPAWLIRLGLLLYDSLGGRKLLPASRSVDLTSDQSGVPLKPIFKKGFEYSDCWVDDARLVVLNAQDAANRGAEILSYNPVETAHRENGVWVITTRSQEDVVQTHSAKVLINASGPWIDLVQDSIGTPDALRIRMVRGSHIVVPGIFDNDNCYIFQNPDNRIIFAIPYEAGFTLIGTTDSDYEGEPGNVSITAEEIQYLCTSIGRYFVKEVQPEDVVWSYSAVRPLLDDGEENAQAATRDYRIEIDEDQNPPLINIYGGKITTYRKLAEDVLGKINQFIPHSNSSWTADEPLPGGDFPVDNDSRLAAKLVDDYHFLSQQSANRLIRLYGTAAWKILGEARNPDDLGEQFGDNLSQAEVDYLIEHEWAICVDDIVWRRTKEGLRLSSQQIEQLETYIQERDLRVEPETMPDRLV